MVLLLHKWCTCCRVCGHIACIVWFLSYGRYHPESIFGVRDWTSTVEDAAREIDFSDSDEDDGVTRDHEEKE